MRTVYRESRQLQSNLPLVHVLDPLPVLGLHIQVYPVTLFFGPLIHTLHSKAKVSYFDMAVSGQKDVFQLQVPM